MATSLQAEAQEATARARYIRMSPYKARRVIDLIRGRHVDDARRVLAFTDRAATATIGKVLNSAVANAEHNHNLPADELVVTRAWVDEGPTLRRYRPRALGRATRIRKRTCHISIVVGRLPEDVEAAAPASEAAPAQRGSRQKTTSAKKTSRRNTRGSADRRAAAEAGAHEPEEES